MRKIKLFCISSAQPHAADVIIEGMSLCYGHAADYAQFEAEQMQEKGIPPGRAIKFRMWLALRNEAT